MKKITKKRAVLFALFILPLVFFLILSTGINNFKKLPVLTNNITNSIAKDSSSTTSFKGKISVVCFFGDAVNNVKGGFFNLNQKIYKPFYGFTDFQMIAVYPEGAEKEVLKFKNEIEAFTDVQKWTFVPLATQEIETLFNSFQTPYELDEHWFSQRVFIVDKELNLRGRLEDKDIEGGKLYGYNTQSVAELNNKMKDDIKVVLAEYRLALKRNKNKRKI